MDDDMFADFDKDDPSKIIDSSTSSHDASGSSDVDDMNSSNQSEIQSETEDYKPSSDFMSSSKSSSLDTTNSSSRIGATISNPDDQQIIQSNEAQFQHLENARAKRFEFLLEQTEIWGHFMKTAYENALTFENSEAFSDAGSSASATSSSGSNGRGKGRKKDSTKVRQNIAISPGGSSLASSNSTAFHFETTPSFIKGGTMRDYQVRGLNWLISLYEKGLSGILADEMGLGKTLQTISLLGYLKHEKNIKGPHLIIAPKSTLPNWMNEVNKWCPSLTAICLIGSKDERRALIKSTFLPKRWNVCITSYEMARIEKSTLAKINYHYVIIDEAQKIKDENTILANAVRTFRSNVRLLLTGTPLQNNLHELWSLLNFLLPDFFQSSEDFDAWFNESNCRENQTLVTRLHTVLRPFLLRRIKADVEKSLPPKTEMRLYVQLAPMQREWYKKTLMNEIQVIQGNGGGPRKMVLYNILMQLRKVCNHPYLFPGAEPQPFTTDSHLVTNSGKMIVLDKLLMKLKAQESRVLLFSQMTRLLDILEDYCIWRKFEYYRLDGNTDYDMRQTEIDEFNSPGSTKFIYLLSTRAGGLGINLASADVVILYDSDWNPQVDLQAMDRAHRIGQTKQVKVFRFVAQDTAEEKIVERAAAKLHLDKMVIQQGRLIKPDSKGPTNVEMLNIVRFGADKILQSGGEMGITESDIDTILEKSRSRSAELDLKLMEMDENSLKNLTIEKVEHKWEPMKESIDTFNFEGQNYRELRKRKTKSFLGDDVIISGKRRKESTPLKYRLEDEDRKGDNDDGAAPIDSEAFLEGRQRTAKPVFQTSQNVRKPTIPLDFQFPPHYLWELHWKELDYYYRQNNDFKVNVSKESSSDSALALAALEVMRVKACQPLTSVESREKEMLISEGFHTWKKKHFLQFIDAMINHGRDNLSLISDAVKGKDIEEVVRYSQVFWMRCHELDGFEEIMRKLGNDQFIVDRTSALQQLIEKKVRAAQGRSLKVKFEPPHWKGSRFSDQDDMLLLSKLAAIQLQTANVFDLLQSQLQRDEDNEISPFLRTRTVEELRSRFNMLIFMVEEKTNNDLSQSSIASLKGGTSLSQDAKDNFKNAGFADPS